MMIVRCLSVLLLSGLFQLCPDLVAAILDSDIDFLENDCVPLAQLAFSPGEVDPAARYRCLQRELS